MNKIQKISLDYLFFFIGSFFALIANLFLGYSSLEDLGLFNKTYAFFIIFGQFFLFSMHENIVKNLNIENNRKKYLSNVFCILFISTTFCLIFFFIIDRFGLYENLFNNIDFFLFSLSIPLFTLNKTFFAILNADKKFNLYFFLNNLRPVLIFFILIFLYLNQINISKVFFISEILLLFLNILIYKKYEINISFKCIDKNSFKKIFNFNFLSLPHSFLSYSFIRIDIIVLSFFVDLYTLGIYSFATMLVEGIYQLLTMMRDRINPELSKLLNKKIINLSLYYKIILFNVFIFILIFIFITFVFFPLFSYYSNIDFNLSKNIFIIISIGLFIFSFSSVFEHIFIMNNQPLYQSIYIIIGNLINIILNILLIKTYGVYGAAIATCLTFSILFLFIYVYLKKIT